MGQVVGVFLCAYTAVWIGTKGRFNAMGIARKGRGLMGILKKIADNPRPERLRFAYARLKTARWKAEPAKNATPSASD